MYTTVSLRHTSDELEMISTSLEFNEFWHRFYHFGHFIAGVPGPAKLNSIHPTT